MTGYRDLVARAKREIREVDADAVRRLIAAGAVIIDVREPVEVAAGTLPGAIAVPRGVLAGEIARIAADPGTPIVLVCSAGNRSALAAKELQDLGYRGVVSLAGGLGAWAGTVPSPPQDGRYARHLVLPGIGGEGQRRLGRARVLVVGAGGLGSPAALYLAAAGVGTVEIVDDDSVAVSNLSRQVLFTADQVGVPKADAAAAALAARNPDVSVVGRRVHLDTTNAIALVAGCDLVVDGSDNLETRYAVNDAAVLLRRPVVHGSVYRWEGRVTVIAPGAGPCYRCLFPAPPPPDRVPDCAAAGVLGAVTGLVGSLMALEAVKVIVGFGSPLVGRLAIVDAGTSTVSEIAVGRDPACVVCRL